MKKHGLIWGWHGVASGCLRGAPPAAFLEGVLLSAGTALHALPGGYREFELCLTKINYFELCDVGARISLSLGQVCSDKMMLREYKKYELSMHC